MINIRGLVRHHPGIGWGLLIGTVAIAGFPPFGVFTSEFLLFTAALHTHPWTVVLLLLGLVLAFAGLFRHVQPMAFGTPPEQVHAIRVNMFPVYIHFGLALWLGLAIPGFLADWYQTAAALLQGVVP